MTKVSGSGSLDRVAHRLDRGVPNGVGGDLQPGRRCPGHQIAELLSRRAPHAAAPTHRHALRAAVDKDLDRAGAHHRTSKTGSNAEVRGRFEQLPREELVDADAEPAVTRQAFVSTKVVGESAVDRRTHRRDPARDEQLLR